MAMFNPKTRYDIIQRGIPIRDFHDYVLKSCTFTQPNVDRLPQG